MDTFKKYGLIIVLGMLQVAMKDARQANGMNDKQTKWKQRRKFRINVWEKVLNILPYLIQ